DGAEEHDAEARLLEREAQHGAADDVRVVADRAEHDDRLAVARPRRRRTRIHAAPPGSVGTLGDLVAQRPRRPRRLADDPAHVGARALLRLAPRDALAVVFG